MFKMLFGANKDIRLILCAFYNIYNVDRVFCRLIDKSKFGKVQGSNIDFYTSYNTTKVFGLIPPLMIIK